MVDHNCKVKMLSVDVHLVNDYMPDVVHLQYHEVSKIQGEYAMDGMGPNLPR